MSARSTLVICQDRRILSDLAPILSQSLPLVPSRDITHYPDRGQMGQLLAQAPFPLCFLDVVSDQAKAIDCISLLAAASPSTKIVVILASKAPDLILTCLRAGAAEFIIAPVTAEQVQEVLSRMKDVLPSASGGKVLAFMPVKGAVGASTLTSSLVYQWKRLGAKKLLVADFDLTAGTLSFLLKTKSNYSFLDALSRADSLDSDLWKGLVTNVNGVDVLLSPETPVDPNHELPDPSPVISFCRQAYDMAAIDLGEPYSYWSRYVAAAVDEVVLVTTNELPALRATQRVMHFLADHQIRRDKIKLVANRYSADVGLAQEAVESAIEAPVLQVIPSEYETVQRAIVEGKPIPLTSSVGKSLAKLADRLMTVKPVEEAPKKKAGLFSFLGSLVSRTAS
ncbi:MAG: hypothetical protein FJW39_21785 [Acidobacteria bacterium]|nr:hypothetical protein [Acidobacteriota bacterium]